MMYRDAVLSAAVAADRTVLCGFPIFINFCGVLFSVRYRRTRIFRQKSGNKCTKAGSPLCVLLFFFPKADIYLQKLLSFSEILV
ncbi:MAG: hypothetical protein HFH26_15055 [Clostridiaceae bacterium]|nr:hypothetical protein [Clostridiaceae bacterium]